MKHIVSPRLAGSMLLFASSMFLTPQAIAVTHPNKISLTSAEQASSESLIATHLSGFSFQVRPSPWRWGGFARGGCPNRELFQSLVPIRDEHSEMHGDSEELASGVVPGYRNAAVHPVFFMAMPEMGAVKGRLYIDELEIESLLDLESINRDVKVEGPGSQQIHKFDFELASQEGGVVGIRVPQNASPLEVGKVYSWRISLSCDRDDPNARIVFSSNGIFEQVTDTTGTPNARLEYYKANNIWQDTLTQIAEDYYNSSNNRAIAEEWNNLMEWVQLHLESTSSGTVSTVRPQLSSIVEIVNAEIPSDE